MRCNDIKQVVRFMWDGDDVSPEIKYKLFITAHFGSKQQQIAEIHAAHFRNKLDRRVMGRGKRLYKILFMEEGTSKSYNERHSHWLFEKPKHMTLKEFESVFCELWQEICGSDNIQILRVQKSRGGHEGLLQYCTKERDWQGYVGNRSFIASFSDNARVQTHRKQSIV